MEGRRWIMKTAWLLMATLTAVSAQVNLAGNCDILTCTGDDECRETMIGVLRGVIGWCHAEPPGNADECTPGEPLIFYNEEAGTFQVFQCNNGDCPMGYTCEFGDICCPDTPKAGICPNAANLNSGDNGRIIECNNDHECRSDDKCCTNSCGGTVCVDPDQPAGGVGVCPTPHFTWLQARRICHKDCFFDSACPGNQKCCVDYHRCGSLCQDPEPSSNCGNTICPGGQWCHMVSPIGCIPTSSNPCFAVPQCISIANACGRNCRCELRWNRRRRTIEPMCISNRVTQRWSWGLPG